MERRPHTRRCPPPVRRLRTYKVRCDSKANPSPGTPDQWPSNDEEYLRRGLRCRLGAPVWSQAPFVDALRARAPKAQNLFSLPDACYRAMLARRTSRYIKDNTKVIGSYL